MDEDIYRRLQQQLDQYSMGFPATDSGIEIMILKKLFSEEDARMFLKLKQKLETPEEIAARVKMSRDDVAKKLRDMAKRGLLFSLKKDDKIWYSAASYLLGLYEFQVKRLDREMAYLFKKYHEERFGKALADLTSGYIRTIPIQHSVSTEHHIASYEDVSEILKKKDKIVVTECMCRKTTNLISKGCDKPLEVCFMFGSVAQYYLDHGLGREVGLDEALIKVTEAQEAGLVTQPASAQNPEVMCNCCGDCCDNLSALNNYSRPAEMVFSNYFAENEKDLCSGCEVCVERCQMAAIEMDEENIAQINLDRCIGCGLCVTTCPTEALTLTPKPPNQHRTPPASIKKQKITLTKMRRMMSNNA
jgi:Fe-S-cluster-containing hydrogenase component 2